MQTHLLYGTALANITIFLVDVVSACATLIAEKNTIVLDSKRMTFWDLR